MLRSNLKGKTALVTGATGGIGKSIARKLAECGSNLILTSKTFEKLTELSSSLSSYNVNVDILSVDLTKIDEVYDFISYVKNKFKGIDILINSAGVFPISNLSDSLDEDYLKTFDVNFRSIFLFSREFSKEMVINKWGRIVNIGSSSAYSGYKETSLYCASKHAVLGFSRSIHSELKEYNVRTYCISPASTKSDMGLLIKNQDYASFIDPEDIAEFVTFSISFDSNIVSNEILLNRMVGK